MLLALTIAAVAAVLVIASMTFWLWRNQERVVFQPPIDAPLAPQPARRVEYLADDKHPLFGYVVGAPSSDASTVVLAFHGNADLAAWTVPWAAELAERAKVTVFLPEYRGYAGIPGTPTYSTAALDAIGALRYAERELKPGRVVFFGHSLGTAIAAELAALHERHEPEVKVESLVLQSPFTSAREMAMRMLMPPLPRLWESISRVHYDTRAAVATLSAKVYVAHGTRDLNIPARMGRSVFAAARHPGHMLLVEGAGHNDVAEVGGEAYWQWIVGAVNGNESRAERRHE